MFSFYEKYFHQVLKVGGQDVCICGWGGGGTGLICFGVRI